MCKFSSAILLLLACSGSSAGPRAGAGGAGEAGSGSGSGSGSGGNRGTGGKGSSGVDARADGVGPDAAVPVDLAPDKPSVAFCDGYAAKFCERLGTCSPPYLSGVYGGMTGCLDRLALECRTEALLVGGGLNAVSGKTCADALGSASCEDLLGNSVPACHLKGTLPKDAACGSNNQCASGFCRMPETAFCGKCDAPAAADGPCDSDDACEFPLLCSEAGRCARAAAEGEFCNETRSCRSLLFCAADNTCKRRAGDGKACNQAAAAPRQPCEIGFTCRPSMNGLCRPIQLVDAGQGCGVSGSTVKLCTGSGSCLNSVCKPPGKDGEACTPSPLGDSGGCLPPARCLQGLCKLPDPASCQ